MAGSLSRRAFLAGAIAIPTASALGCGGGSGTSAGGSTRSSVRTWNDMALAAIRVNNLGPPMIARALAIQSTCAFDAWAAYDSKATGTRVGGTLRRPVGEQTLANKQKAISFAVYRALLDLFPAQAALFDAQMTAFGYDHTDVSIDLTTPSGLGNRVAADILGFRHTDGSNQLGDLHPGAYTDYTGYTSVNDPDNINDPNHWQPLRVSDGNGGFVIPSYVGPFWGMVKPFALSSGSQFRPNIALPQAGSPEYAAQAQIILDYSANLTDLQKVLTEYFADGPKSEQPPGHWYLFAEFVAQRDGHDLDTDVQMFFLLGNALMDAGIACWEAKRFYNSVRPVTAIHYAFKGKTVRAWGGPGKGTISMQGESFGTFQSPTFVTPAFPEFNSGHSAFSASAAEVLKRFKGNDALGFSVTFPQGSSKLEPGVTPSVSTTVTFDTFSNAADSAGMSRRYGGIHFVDGDLTARAMGRSVGAVVWEKAQGYINGTA